MKKIALLNQKGGVGKSNLTINLSCYFAKRKHKVLILDADVQQTVYDWSKIGAQKDVDVEILGASSLSQKLNSITGYNYVFVDMPGALDELSAEAIINVDFILIPLQASMADIKSTIKVIEWIKVANKEAVARTDLMDGQQVKWAMLFSRISPRAIINRRARKGIEKLELPLFRYAVSERKVFRESYEKGVSVFDFSPYDLAAEQEVVSVYDELKEKLHGD